jgi:hypothetical protein
VNILASCFFINMLKVLLLASLVAISPGQIKLKSGSVISESQLIHAVDHYCLVHKAKTLQENISDTISDIDSILDVPRTINFSQFMEGKLSSKEHGNRYQSDVLEVNSMITNRVKTQCQG